MASKYVYQTHLPADHVRLLTLVSDGKNFGGSLEEFRRGSLPYFNALSWCWWSRREKHIIAFICDGQLFPVSQHLYDLLSNLNPRNAHSSVRIWIDSICINQEHIEEKNFHVAHMHDIYGQARNVVVWLGTPEDGSDLVMDSKKISELNKTLQLLPGSNIARSVTVPELPYAEDPVWKAIGRLCDRDSFYRTWVIQEIALARKAELLCGSQRLDWDEFVNLIWSVSRAGLTSICRGPRSTGMTRPDGFGVLMDLSWTKTMVQNNVLSMNYLLHMVRLKEVTKPVDKVYGLLGIIGEDMRSTIKVNYAENDRQYWKAYVELAEQTLTADDPEKGPNNSQHGVRTEIPSRQSILISGIRSGEQGSDKATQDGGIRLIKDSSSIQIPGFQIDVVDEVFHIGGPYSAAVGQEDRGRNGNMAAFLERDRQCLELTLHLFDDVNNAQDAYARTLIVNSWVNDLLIQLSQTEQVRNAYKDSKTCLAQSDASATEATHVSVDEERQQLAQQYITQLGWWQERPFYTTKNGRIGRGAFNMRASDAIGVFYRAGPVFVLRYEQGSEVWKLVGDVYLHGCMDLETMPKAGRGPDVKFTIS